jgi:hypothetical protein
MVSIVDMLAFYAQALQYSVDWKTMDAERVSYATMLLERLEVKALDERISAAKILLYIAQGIGGGYLNGVFVLTDNSRRVWSMRFKG